MADKKKLKGVGNSQDNKESFAQGTTKWQVL